MCREFLYTPSCSTPYYEQFTLAMAQLSKLKKWYCYTITKCSWVDLDFNNFPLMFYGSFSRIQSMLAHIWLSSIPGLLWFVTMSPSFVCFSVTTLRYPGQVFCRKCTIWVWILIFFCRQNICTAWWYHDYIFKSYKLMKHIKLTSY